MPSRSLYFAGPFTDFLLIGGASIALWFYFRTAPDITAAEVSQFVVLYLVWLGNAPHFAATSYRLYHSKANIAQYPYTAILVPLLVLLGIAGSLAWPTRLAPYFVKLYLLWSPYHYSGQAVGISLIYARRMGTPIGKLQRIGLSAFVYGAYLSSSARAEAAVTQLSFFGIRYPTLGLPIGISYGLEAVMWTGAAVFLFCAARSRLAGGKRLPLIALVPAVAHYFWLVRGPGLMTYFQLVPFFHGVQYLLVAWYMQKAESPGASTVRVAWRWSIVNILGGIALFAGLPQLLMLFSKSPFLFIAPIAIAGVQIHHFFVDGVIWKLRNPRVGNALAGAA